MHLGFSCTGLIFLIMLMIPNMIWAKNQPVNYEKYVVRENRCLLLFERVGEVCVSSWCLFFRISTGMVCLHRDKSKCNTYKKVEFQGTICPKMAN